MESIELDNELKQRLINSLDKVEEWVRAGEGLVKEQAPLVVQDIINWGIFGYGISAVASFVSVVIMIFIIISIGKKARSLTEAKDECIVFACVLTMIGCAVVTILLAINFVTSSPVALKATFAPRVYVLEQLGIMKNK